MPDATLIRYIPLVPGPLVPGQPRRWIIYYQIRGEFRQRVAFGIAADMTADLAQAVVEQELERRAAGLH